MKPVAMLVIISLNLGCSPSAISRLVVPVVVDAIDTQSFGLRSHVGKEILKLAPSLADLDAAAAVTMPSFIFPSGASVSHGAPNSVLGSVPHSMSSFSVSSTAPIYLKASATSRVPITQRGARNINKFAASTTAMPDYLSLIALRSAG